MPDALSWFDPEREFSQVFASTKGWIVVSAAVSIEAREVHLSDFDYRPLETDRLVIGVKEALTILRQITERAMEEGYTSVVVDGIRTSGRNPNRPVRYERRTR